MSPSISTLPLLSLLAHGILSLLPYPPSMVKGHLALPPSTSTTAQLYHVHCQTLYVYLPCPNLQRPQTMLTSHINSMHRQFHLFPKCDVVSLLHHQWVTVHLRHHLSHHSLFDLRSWWTVLCVVVPLVVPQPTQYGTPPLIATLLYHHGRWEM